MGEEALELVDMVAYAADDDRVMEWETGLPGADELTPLSQPLVPPGLAAAFRIPPEPGRTLLDVHRASAATVSRLRRASSSSSAAFPPYQDQTGTPAAAAARGAAAEEADDSLAATNGGKRPRLVWTPQLHKRFVDVVAHLGIKNAVPKTIMQLMNVEGLTRENVASHLQKYRLYVKRMQGLSNEGPSPSDHIFASTPVPHSLVHEPQPQQVPTPSSYGPHAPPAASMMYHHHHRIPMPACGGGAGAGAYYAAGYPYHHHADK